MEAATDIPKGAPAPPGMVLAEARERQGMSRAEVAQRLHMSPYQIEAIESGDYTRLPTGTFLRGFVRNYAKILGVDPAPLLARLAENVPRGPTPGIVVPSQNIRFDPIGERLGSPYVKAAAVGTVLVSLGFAALYWWFFIRPEPPGTAARKPAVEQGPPQQLAVAPMQPPAPVAPTPAPIMTEPARPEPIQKPGTAPGPIAAAPEKRLGPDPGPIAAAPASAGAGSGPNAGSVPNKRDRVIKLRFKGESWVEIRDGQGRLLVSRIHYPGSEAEVVGRPPFTVVVGNAPDVQMTYNERDFSLEPHTRVAVARFTVE